jgi:hypothetical protein
LAPAAMTKCARLRAAPLRQPTLPHRSSSDPFNATVRGGFRSHCLPRFAAPTIQWLKIKCGDFLMQCGVNLDLAGGFAVVAPGAANCGTVQNFWPASATCCHNGVQNTAASECLIRPHAIRNAVQTAVRPLGDQRRASHPSTSSTGLRQGSALAAARSRRPRYEAARPPAACAERQD